MKRSDLYQGIYQDFIGKHSPHPPQNQTTDEVDAQPVQNFIITAVDQAVHSSKGDIPPGQRDLGFSNGMGDVEQNGEGIKQYRHLKQITEVFTCVSNVRRKWFFLPGRLKVVHAQPTRNNDPGAGDVHPDPYQ